MFYRLIHSKINSYERFDIVENFPMHTTIDLTGFSYLVRSFVSSKVYCLYCIDNTVYSIDNTVYSIDYTVYSIDYKVYLKSMSPTVL